MIYFLIILLLIVIYALVNNKYKKNDFLHYDNKQYEKANILIKQATQLKKENKTIDAIAKIKKALSIYKMDSWFDKLASYQFNTGLKKEAFITLKEWENFITKDYGNQFSYDIGILNRKRIWEKDKFVKDKYELLIQIKTVITKCLHNEYKKKPSFYSDFIFEENQKEYKKYISKVKKSLIELNERVNLIHNEYDKKFENYEIDVNETHYEGYNRFKENDKQVKDLIHKIKQTPISYENELTLT